MAINLFPTFIYVRGLPGLPGIPGLESPVYREKFNGADGNKMPFLLNEKSFCFTFFWKM